MGTWFMELKHANRMPLKYHYVFYDVLSPALCNVSQIVHIF